MTHKEELENQKDNIQYLIDTFNDPKVDIIKELDILGHQLILLSKEIVVYSTFTKNEQLGAKHHD